jgi:hypothetical protein
MRLGQASLDLLLAIYQGRVTRTDRSLQADYVIDGGMCSRLLISSLRARELVTMPLSGPPRVTAEGEKVLRAGGLIG